MKNLPHPLGTPGRAPGVSVWSMVAAVPKTGGFEILH